MSKVKLVDRVWFVKDKGGNEGTMTVDINIHGDFVLRYGVEKTHYIGFSFEEARDKFMSVHGLSYDEVTTLQ